MKLNKVGQRLPVEKMVVENVTTNYFMKQKE